MDTPTQGLLGYGLFESGYVVSVVRPETRITSYLHDDDRMFSVWTVPAVADSREK